jgi:hypothetical protein
MPQGHTLDEKNTIHSYPGVLLHVVAPFDVSRCNTSLPSMDTLSICYAMNYSHVVKGDLSL